MHSSDGDAVCTDSDAVSTNNDAVYTNSVVVLNLLPCPHKNSPACRQVSAPAEERTPRRGRRKTKAGKPDGLPALAPQGAFPYLRMTCLTSK